MSYIEEGYNFLLGVNDPKDDEDGVTSRNADEIFQDHSVEFNFTTMDNFQPDQDMQSSNFVTGLKGWKIYGDGFAEFAGITLTGGLLHYNKTSFTDSSVSGYYISPDGIYFGDAGDATKLKFDINTGVLDFVGTVSGRDTADVATAINADANIVTDVINPRLDTQSEEILGDYDFGASGSLSMAVDSNNGIFLSPTGILGKKAGVPTFTITTSGDATFAGTLAALGGTFGTITAGSLTLNTLVGGRLAVTIGGAINASGAFINDVINTNLNTQTKAILGEFVFTGVGALKMATDANNGLWLSPTGILGKKAGVTTFAVDTGGNATFGGSLIAADGTFGTITSGNLTGVTITGASIQTAVAYPKMILNTSNLTGYDSITVKRMQLDKDSLEFYNTTAPGQRTMTLSESGIRFYEPVTQSIKSTIFYSDPPDVLSLVAPEGSVKGFQFNVKTSSLTYHIADLYFPAAGTAIFDLTLQSASRIQSNWFAAGSSGYINFGTTYGSLGYGFRMKEEMNSSVIEYFDSTVAEWTPIATAGGGTVTQVNTTDAITGGPITTIGTIGHSTADGYKHIPSGGSVYQMLYNTAAGAASWTSALFVGGSNLYNFSVVSGMIRSSTHFSVNGYMRVDDNLEFEDTTSRIIFYGTSPYGGTAYTYGPYLLNYKDHAGVNQSKYVLAQLSP